MSDSTSEYALSNDTLYSISHPIGSDLIIFNCVIYFNLDNAEYFSPIRNRLRERVQELGLYNESPIEYISEYTINNDDNIDYTAYYSHISTTYIESIRESDNEGEVNLDNQNNIQQFLIINDFDSYLVSIKILSFNTIAVNDCVIRCQDLVSYLSNSSWQPQHSDLSLMFLADKFTYFTDWKLDKEQCVLIKYCNEWVPLFWFHVNDYYNYVYLFFIVKRISIIELGFIQYYLNSSRYFSYLIVECKVPPAVIYCIKWSLEICFNKLFEYNGIIIKIAEKRLILSEIKNIPYLSLKI